MSNISYCKHDFYFDNCRICFPRPKLRELSDEEILEVWNAFERTDNIPIIDFAKAILKKASEK